MAQPAAQQPVTFGLIRVDPSSWEGNWKIIDANVSTSATEGTRYAKVRGDHELTIKLPMGDPDALTLAGLQLGDVVAAIYCQHGAATADLLEYALCTSMPVTCDNTTDVPRITATFKGGDLTRNVTYTA